MTKERSGLIRLSMAFVEESDIGTYGLRVFNEHGEQKFLTASNTLAFLGHSLETTTNQSCLDYVRKPKM